MSITEDLKEKRQRLMVVVPDGKTAWKEGELERGIEEHVTKGPCLHINRENADYHMDRVRIMDPETAGLLKVVFEFIELDPESEVPMSDQIREYTAGIRHIAGLIDLTLKLNITHGPITTNWQYPEQLLHPAQTLNITDMVMKMIAIIDKRHGDKRPPTIEVGEENPLDKTDETIDKQKPTQPIEEQTDE